jgi:hypothetical protein
MWYSVLHKKNLYIVPYLTSVANFMYIISSMDAKLLAGTAVCKVSILKGCMCVPCVLLEGCPLLCRLIGWWELVVPKASGVDLLFMYLLHRLCRSTSVSDVV